MSSTKLEEGDKLMAKAAKATTPSLLSFRFSPDWEAAAPFFGQAAQCYRYMHVVCFFCSTDLSFTKK